MNPSKIIVTLSLLLSFAAPTFAQTENSTQQETLSSNEQGTSSEALQRLEDKLLEEKAIYNEMKQELENELLEEKAIYNELLQKYEVLEKRAEEYQTALKEKNSQDTTAKLAQSRMVQVLREELEASQAKIDKLTNRVSVRIGSHLLFKQGTAYISAEGFKALDQLAPVLKKQLDQQHIHIEGHTDSTQISKKLRKIYPTNWELSTERAVKVLRYLVDEHQFNPAHLSATGFGPFQPIADNTTYEGKKMNRRVEFVIVSPQKR